MSIELALSQSSKEHGPYVWSDRVVILDEIHLPVSEVEAWLGHWRTHYLPGALERHLELRGIWTGWTDDPDHKLIVICWTAARVGVFWGARLEAEDDATVSAFWDWSASREMARSRRVLENLSPAGPTLYPHPGELG